jgi:hypothetical protein
MAKDKAGHSNQTSVNFTINTTILDTTPPWLVITFPSENGTICSNTSIVVYGTARDNAGVQMVEWWDNGPMTTWQNASTSDGWGNWSISCPLNIGTNYMWVCATDINGLRTTCRVMVVRTEQPVHYEPPVVEITQPEDGYGQTYEQFYIAWKAHCNVSLYKYDLMINGRVYDWEEFGPNTTSVNRTFKANLKIGYATIKVTVTDITGHNGSDEWARCATRSRFSRPRRWPAPCLRQPWYHQNEGAVETGGTLEGPGAGHKPPSVMRRHST